MCFSVIIIYTTDSTCACTYILCTAIIILHVEYIIMHARLLYTASYLSLMVCAATDLARYQVLPTFAARVILDNHLSVDLLYIYVSRFYPCAGIVILWISNIRW